MPLIAQTIEEALAPIGDGITLAVPREVAGVPMEATRALLRRGVRNLHLVTLPTSSLQADLLIGAGAVAVLETSAVSSRRIRTGAALHRRNDRRHHPHFGGDLSGAACGVPSGREGRAVHAAARHSRL